jgi:hypothetical protein
MTRPFAHLALAAAITLSAVTPAAEAWSREDFAGAEVLSLEQLDEVRAGLQLPGGAEFGFGAVMSTFVDGSLALQTRLTWTEMGPVETVDFGMLTPDLMAAAAAGGIRLDGGPAVQGLVVGGDGGITAVVHSVSGEHLSHLVLNNANNRDIRQSTDITLDIPGFAQMQQEIAAQNVDLRLQSALGLALRDAAIR